MHRMALRLASFVLTASAIFAQLPRTDPSAAGFSPERLERLDAAIERHIEEKEIAGAVTLIARDGKIVHFNAQGMADIEAGKPMREDSLFRIASMTKPITSVTVMTLYEEGLFRLSDPVGDYIPSFRNMTVLPPEGSGGEPAPAKRPILIRHLLTHTSGLSYHWNERLGKAYGEARMGHGLLQQEGTIGEAVDRLAKAPLLFEPGEQWHYGLSIDVLGRLVEVVSGRPFDAFLRERIFEPLGMDDTHFFLPQEKVGRLAAVYRRQPGEPIAAFGPQPIVEDYMVYVDDYPYNGPKTYFSGGGGLVSTAGDYARFCQMLLNGGELDGVRVLGPKTVEIMTVNQVGDLNPEQGFGLGFFVIREGDQGELISRGTYGWGGFWNTRFFIDPQEGLFGIFMSQLHPSGGSTIHDRFRNLVYQALVRLH